MFDVRCSAPSKHKPQSAPCCDCKIGHLIEMCSEKNSAEIHYNKIQLIEGAKELAQKFVAPDNTYRNWKSYDGKVSGITGESLITLCDPQTSGGLMIAVAKEAGEEFSEWLKQNDFKKFSEPIGQIKKKGDFVISVK